MYTCDWFMLMYGRNQHNIFKAIHFSKNNRALNIIGILVTMFTPRFKLSKEVLSELENYYFGLIFDQKISRSIVASESSSFAEPLYYYSKYSKISLEYMDVAKEIILRTEGIL